MKTRPAILLMTKFGRPWNNGHFMAQALEAMGWPVIRMDTPSQLGELPSALDQRPLLAMATKADGMTVDMVRDIRGRGIPFVIWYPDSIPPQDHMVRLGKEADYFFTVSQGRVRDYQVRGVGPVAWLTQAFSPSFYPETALSQADLTRYGSEVAFVGNLGTLPYYQERREMLERVVKAGFNLKWWGPKPSRKLKDIRFLLSRVCRAYGGEFVYLDTYSKVARAAKVFLAMDAFPDLRLSMSVRLFTAVGCGAFYMCRRIEGIEEVLVPGREIEVFGDYDEMEAKIRYYVTHEEERRRIAQAGRERVLRGHTYRHRFGTMFDILRTAGLLDA